MSVPPRLKVYGLLRLSRRAYLTVQIAGLFLAVAAIALGLCLPRPDVPRGVKLPGYAGAVVTVLDWLPWFGLLVLIYEGCETYLILKKFRQLEAQPSVGPASRAGPEDSAARLAESEGAARLAAPTEPQPDSRS